MKSKYDRNPDLKINYCLTPTGNSTIYHFQFIHSQGLILAGLGLIVSIAVFNWAGVSITTHVNATFRMILG